MFRLTVDWSGSEILAEYSRTARAWSGNQQLCLTDKYI